MSFFTIIMPTFNQGAYIQTAVRSVLDQADADVELLVYDTLSSDSTPEFLRTLGNHITWIREKDHGQVDALNRGLRTARGEVLAWLNSDDAYLPGALAAVARTFRENPDLDFVYGDALEMDEQGNILTPNLFTEDFDKKRYLYSHNYLCQPAVFFRQTLIDKVGLLREDLKWSMDYEWFGRFFLHGCRGLRLPCFLAANRDYPQTKTNSGGFTRYREMIKVLASRPGRPPILRRVFWIYSLEAVIKALNQSASTGNFFSHALSFALGKLFKRLVNPRSRLDIIARFNSQIKDRTIDELWERSK